MMPSSVHRQPVKTIHINPIFSRPTPSKRRKVCSYISPTIIILTAPIFVVASVNIVSQLKHSIGPATVPISIGNKTAQTIIRKGENKGDPIADKHELTTNVKGESEDIPSKTADHRDLEGRSENLSISNDQSDEVNDATTRVSNNNSYEESEVTNDESERVSRNDEQEQSILMSSVTRKCLQHFLYDKPVKTGSTAIMSAIHKYLNDTGRWDHSCSNKGPHTCTERAEEICDGSVKRENRYSIIGHFQYASKQLVECLRPNYYYVTSVRDPYQRRKSAYLWNRTMNGTHFSIPHTVSLSEFMNRLPRCQLYHYYDGHGLHCNGTVSVEQRLQEILDRVDEVIDVFDEPVGPLHKLIAKYLRKENESIKTKEEDFVQDFDRDTLREEQMLYDRLREVRMKTPNPSRLPCEKALNG